MKLKLYHPCYVQHFKYYYIDQNKVMPNHSPIQLDYILVPDDASYKILSLIRHMTILNSYLNHVLVYLTSTLGDWCLLLY